MLPFLGIRKHDLYFVRYRNTLVTLAEYQMTKSLNERLSQGGDKTNDITRQPADEAIATAYSKEVTESTSFAYLTGMLDERAVAAISGKNVVATTPKGDNLIYQQELSTPTTTPSLAPQIYHNLMNTTSVRVA